MGHSRQDGDVRRHRLPPVRFPGDHEWLQPPEGHSSRAEAPGGHNSPGGRDWPEEPGGRNWLEAAGHAGPYRGKLEAAGTTASWTLLHAAGGRLDHPQLNNPVYGGGAWSVKGE